MNHRWTLIHTDYELITRNRPITPWVVEACVYLFIALPRKR
jgi:hypothetical protein